MARISSLALAITGLVVLSACTAPSPVGSASQSGAAAQSSASAAAPSADSSSSSESESSSMASTAGPVKVMSCTQEYSSADYQSDSNFFSV